MRTSRLFSISVSGSSDGSGFSVRRAAITALSSLILFGQSFSVLPVWAAVDAEEEKSTSVDASSRTDPTKKALDESSGNSVSKSESRTEARDETSGSKSDTKKSETKPEFRNSPDEASIVNSLFPGELDGPKSSRPSESIKNSDKMPPLAPNVVRKNSAVPPSSSSESASSQNYFRKSDSVLDKSVYSHFDSISPPGSRPSGASASSPQSGGAVGGAKPPATGDSNANSVRISRPGKEPSKPSTTAGSQPTQNPARISRPGAAPPVAPPIGSASTSATNSSNASNVGASGSAGTAGFSAPAPGSAPPAAVDNYPAVGRLEQVTLGAPHTELDINDRLANLEKTVFAKTYEFDSLFDRTERLKRTVLGTDPVGPAAGGDTAFREPPADMNAPSIGMEQQDESDYYYLDDLANNPDNQAEVGPEVLQDFAIELINYERNKRAMDPITFDPLVGRMAQKHVKDLVRRSVVSHSGSKGNNPDRRFTLLGGVDAVTESLSTVDASELGSSNMSKASVARMMKKMLQLQDDRESMLSAAATHAGFAEGKMSNGSKLVCCLEIMTKRGIIQPAPVSTKPGDSLEIEGIIMSPYQFDRITIAWEGMSDEPLMLDEEPEEALPYFPPLDFIAYKEKSEKDYTKAVTALKTVGLLAAIAGGMFVPPVALAAPLIVMAGPSGNEVKPVSDIPVKGGVKVDGGNFRKKVKLSNDGKEGLYYITVWASLGQGTKPVAVSRRTILAVEEENKIRGEKDQTVQESKPSDTPVITETDTGEIVKEKGLEAAQPAKLGDFSKLEEKSDTRDSKEKKSQSKSDAKTESKTNVSDKDAKEDEAKNGDGVEKDEKGDEGD